MNPLYGVRYYCNVTCPEFWQSKEVDRADDVNLQEIRSRQGFGIKKIRTCFDVKTQNLKILGYENQKYLSLKSCDEVLQADK